MFCAGLELLADMGASCAYLFWLLLRKTDNPITRAAAMIAPAKTLLFGDSPLAEVVGTGAMAGAAAEPAVV